MSTGNITVGDENSKLTLINGTNLGYGHGEMNISNEGLVSNGGSSLGYGETGVGIIRITTGDVGGGPIRMSIPPLVLRASETSNIQRWR